MRARSWVTALAGIGLLAVAGCQGQPDGSDTSSSTSSSSQPSPTATDRAHEVFSRGQLVDAMPTAEQIGSGWRFDPQQTLYDPDGAGGLSPESCRAIDFKGPAWDEVSGTIVGRTTENYLSGDDDNYMFVAAMSFEQPLTSAMFDEAGDAIGRCQRWSFDSTKYTTRSMTAPDLGDRALRLGHDATDPRSTYRLDSLRFMVGHTLVYVSHASHRGDPDPRTTERAARTVLANLKETS